jgi:tRNA dimethylallyltransferase
MLEQRRIGALADDVENKHAGPMKLDAVLIAGPTASGKSALALRLAEHFHGAVINADSMQVYKEAPILTAQPDLGAKAAAPHLLYGHVPAAEAYSVARYAEDAARALAEAKAMGWLPIFTGGTGLYFMALTEGLAEIPPVPADIRAEARALLAEIGVSMLHARLAAVDARTAAQLKPSDPQRVLRAYEVWAATGRPLAEWQDKPGAPVLGGLRLAKFVLDPPRELLRARIEERFRRMVEEGAIAEAAVLENLDPALPAAKLLGLKPLIGLARGRLGKNEAILEAVTATRQFAKRQTTWFRNRMADYVRLDPNESNIITSLSDFVA